MPKVGSKYTKFCFEKKKKTKKKQKQKKNKNKQTAFGFEKKNPTELGFLGSISQTKRKCIYEHWTTGAGWR